MPLPFIVWLVTKLNQRGKIKNTCLKYAGSKIDWWQNVLEGTALSIVMAFHIYKLSKILYRDKQGRDSKAYTQTQAFSTW